MGGFQAVAAGLSSGIEDAAQGTNAAFNTALKTADIQHGWQQEAVRNKLQQQIADQNYTLGQQSHDLMRQQLMQQGWHDLGVSKDANGAYQRTLYNPVSGQSRVVPSPGLPPDSPEAKLKLYSHLLNDVKGPDNKPQLTSSQAWELSTGFQRGYQGDPAGQTASYAQLAKQMFENGVTNTTIPGMGKFNLSTPEGQYKYAQAMEATTRPGAGLYRVMNPGAWAQSSPSRAGKLVDTSGMTAGEKREYDASVKPYSLQMQYLDMAMKAEMSQVINPADAGPIMQRYQGQVMPLLQQMQQARDGIMGKRAGATPGAAGAAGKTFSTSAFLAKHPNATAQEQAAALNAATAAGATVKP